MSVQAGLGKFNAGVKEQKAHLTNRKPAGCSSTLSVSKDREFWCTRCNHRVSVGTSGQEYGHRSDCEFFEGVQS